MNDILPERLTEFWRDAKGREYFDGCIRDEKQGRCAYRYTLLQGERHGIVNDYRLYRHTRVYVDLEVAIDRARTLGAFLNGLRYKRFQRDPGPAR